MLKKDNVMNNYIGVDIGGTKMLLVAEYQGEYIERKLPTGKSVSREYLKTQLNKFIAQLPFQPQGIGMAIPGFVVGSDLVLSSDVVPSLDGITPAYFSSNNTKVWFINDVKSALVEESQYYPEDYTITLFMVGTGIAVATKANSKLVLGAKGISGELGFAPIAVNKEVYTVDSLASGAAILNKAGMPIDLFLEKLNQKNKTAISIIEEAGFYFGIALSIVINIINPNIVVVGGKTSTFPGYMEQTVATAKKYAVKEAIECCQFTSPKNKERVVALGARRFAFQNKIQ
jgi:glucokinase